MANYTAISDVGNTLVRIFRDYMVPDVISDRESIGLCSPDDPGDLMLGVYLYDITENTDYRDNAMFDINDRKQRYPSTYLTLHYMITAYSQADMKFRGAEEHKILGKVVQIMGDYNVLDELSLEISNEVKGMNLRITLERIPMDEKVKMWPTSNRPYKTSLFYSIVPVAIESEKIRDISRVTEINMQVEEK